MTKIRLGALSLILATTIVATFGMDVPPQPTLARHIAHLAIIEPGSRLLALVDREASLHFPTVIVPDNQYTDSAILEWVQRETGYRAPSESLHYCAKIELQVDPANLKEANLSWIYGLLDPAQQLQAQVPTRVTHHYYIHLLGTAWHKKAGRALGERGNLKLFSIEDLYEKEGQVAARPVLPLGTLDLLRIATHVKHGEEQQTEQQIITRFIRAAGLQNFNPRVQFFIPVSMMEADAMPQFLEKARVEAQKLDAARQKVRAQNETIENILLVPAGLLFISMYASKSCSIQ